MHRLSTFAVAAAVALLQPLPVHALPEIIGVVEAGLNLSQVGFISTDGTKLPASRLAGPEQEAVYWEVGTVGPEATVVALGSLGAPPNDFQTADAASDDGIVIVGIANNMSSMSEAYRWTAASDMVGLGFLPTHIFSQAFDVSGNGAAVTGQSFLDIREPHGFYWTQSGLVDIGDLEGGIFSTVPTAISKDGTTVVGLGRSASGSEAFRWTQAGGIVGLGDLEGGSFASIARDVSEDGSVVVGWSQSASGREAFRWTAAGGIQTLSGVPVNSEAWGVSSDGKVVVGEYLANFSDNAFVWDEARGFQDLSTLLVAENPDVFGLDWFVPLQRALAISDDGTVLQAEGNAVATGFQSVVVVGFSLPEPSSGLCGAAAMAALGILSRRRGRRPERAFAN